MKVVHITPFFQLDVQRWTEKLVFNQKKYFDYDIVVITTNLNTAGKPVYAVGTEEIDGITIKRVKGIKLKNQFIPTNRDSIRKFKCDIVHIHNFGTLFCELILLPNKEIPTVLKPDIGRLYPPYNVLKKIELDHVNIVTAFNDREIGILKKMGFDEERIRMIPWGVEDRYREEGRKIKPKENEILIVARVIPIKNIELAIKAVAKLQNTNLNIVGPIENVEYFDFLRKLCKKLDVERRVRFKGAVPYSELSRVYAQNYLTLATSFHESGGPASVIESLATGRPAICVPLELVKNLRKYYADDDSGGVIVVDYDPTELAEKIEYLQENRKAWRKLSKSGLNAAQKFTWRRVVEEVDRIYTSLLQ